MPRPNKMSNSHSWTANETQLSMYSRIQSHELTIQEAAAQAGVHRNTMRRWITMISDQLYNRYATHVGHIRVGHTEALSRVARRAMQAYEISTQDSVVTHERSLPNGESYVETTTSRGRGDPAQLHVVLKALQDIRGIWGADAPKQIDVAAVVEQLPTEDRLEAIAQRMRELIPTAAATVLSDEAAPVAVSKVSPIRVQDPSGPDDMIREAPMREKRDRKQEQSKAAPAKEAAAEADELLPQNDLDNHQDGRTS